MSINYKTSDISSFSTAADFVYINPSVVELVYN